MANQVELVSSPYKTMAKNQTSQPLSSTGAAGDVLDGILIVPETTSPGVVTLIDGATSITIFTGGAGSVSNLVPIPVPLFGIRSTSGGWKVTTGDNVHILAAGRIT